MTAAKESIHRTRLPRLLAGGLYLLILAGVAYFSFSLGKGFALTSPFEGMPNFSPGFGENPPSGEGDLQPGGNPADSFGGLPSGEGGPSVGQWEGASRVTVLVMGLDYRDWESGEGAPRTDTMILLTVDPLSRTAGMLSIPRDLYVPIPGFEYGRINTAYRLGEIYQLPGGGPALAMKTVEQFLGVPVDYYAQVDFGAFERLIDEIGGLKLEIKEPIKVDPIGEKPPKTLKPGVTVLPGPLALAYARARNTEGGDFDRAQRQQQVILAIRKRILEFDLIPTLITRAPQLYQELSGGVRTNMSLEQAMQLGWLAKDIPAENIQQAVIGPEQVVFFQSPDGDQLLKPIPDKIRQLRDQVFANGDFGSPLVRQMTLEERLLAEAANIAILNGTFTNGLAGRTIEYLNSLGLAIPPENAGNASQGYVYTTLIDYTGNPYTVAFLVEKLNISPNNVFMRYDPSSAVDVEVNLGSDWAGNNPMP